MLRDYIPLPLIPAAWALTFATIVFPGIDTYWILHMNIFITGFLGLFGAASWVKMSNDKVLRIWRNIIAAGFLASAIGSSGFFMEEYIRTFSVFSILYWFLVPAVGFKMTSEIIEDYGKTYQLLWRLSLFLTLLFITGSFFKSKPVLGISLIGIAGLQTVSIFIASKMDKGW